MFYLFLPQRISLGEICRFVEWPLIQSYSTMGTSAGCHASLVWGLGRPLIIWCLQVVAVPLMLRWFPSEVLLRTFGFPPSKFSLHLVSGWTRMDIGCCPNGLSLFCLIEVRRAFGTTSWGLHFYNICTALHLHFFLIWSRVAFLLLDRTLQVRGSYVYRDTTVILLRGLHGYLLASVLLRFFFTAFLHSLPLYEGAPKLERRFILEDKTSTSTQFVAN